MRRVQAAGVTVHRPRHPRAGDRRRLRPARGHAERVLTGPADWAGHVQLPVMPPVKPMLAKPVATIPPGRLYEPKWDGFRSIVFRDGDEVEIGSRNERPMTRYFPEVVAAVLANFPERSVIDGEIVVADTARNTLDFEALQQRIHPAASRVTLLAEQTPASFIAFDLLALGDDDLTESRWSAPRAARGVPRRREAAGARHAGHPRPRHRASWFDLFEGAGLDGLIAKKLDLSYQPDKRVMTKIKHERTADCVVAGYRVHKSGPDAIGSLLLGLYDERGRAGLGRRRRSFPDGVRRELFAELQPLVTTFEAPVELGGHEQGDPRKNETSRWNAGKDLSFVPLRPERVVEVRYDYMEASVPAHRPVRAVAPDREPESCTWRSSRRPVGLPPRGCARRLLTAQLGGGRARAVGHRVPACRAAPRPWAPSRTVPDVLPGPGDPPTAGAVLRHQPRPGQRAPGTTSRGPATGSGLRCTAPGSPPALLPAEGELRTSASGSPTWVPGRRPRRRAHPDELRGGGRPAMVAETCPVGSRSSGSPPTGGVRRPRPSVGLHGTAGSTAGVAAAQPRGLNAHSSSTTWSRSSPASPPRVSRRGRGLRAVDRRACPRRPVSSPPGARASELLRVPPRGHRRPRGRPGPPTPAARRAGTPRRRCPRAGRPARRTARAPSRS